MFKSVVENLKEFDQSVSELRSELEPLFKKKKIEQCLEEATPIQKAKLNLVMLYTVNSTVWAYLRLIGKDPKNLAVKGELDRVRDYMKRAKEVEDQLTSGEPTLRVNKEAAKRTVKHALWQAAQTKNKKADDGAAEVTEAPSSSQPKEAGKESSGEKTNSQQTSAKRKSNYVVDQFILDEDNQEKSEPKSPEKRQKKA